MSKPEEVEQILARLMPTPMSEAGEAEICASIDELAEEAGISSDESSRRSGTWSIGIAAAVALSAILILQRNNEKVAKPELAQNSEWIAPVVQLGQSDVVESIHEEGWHEDENGTAHQAVRVKLVAQQEILDPETGIRMTVSEPREEWLLVPVYAF